MSDTLTSDSSSPLSFGEPYRYQCPECGTHLEGGLTRRAGHPGDTTRWGERDDPDAAFYCRHCRAGRRELYDKKTEETVHVGTCDRSTE